MAKTTKRKAVRPVLVTTIHRGVFFGYVPEDLDTETCETLTLTDARNCIYWSADVRGFVGLAATGPSASCRVGPKATIELRGITAVLDMTPEAVARWESGPWAA